MDEILHHFETMGNRLLLAFYRAIIIPGFLRWCEADFVHPQYHSGREAHGQNCSLNRHLFLFSESPVVFQVLAFCEGIVQGYRVRESPTFAHAISKETARQV